ncbi:MAG: hypothetical protein RIS70_943 [Planctomycetota bacterium]|jgi:hypothetical protein
MKRFVLIAAVVMLVLLASAPADAACGRIRAGVRDVATAPFRLIRAVRHRHGRCGATRGCQNGACNCEAR